MVIFHDALGTVSAQPRTTVTSSHVKPQRRDQPISAAAWLCASHSIRTHAYVAAPIRSRLDSPRESR